MFDLAPSTIFLTLAGSHAHGTAGESSDVDVRGVCVAPLRVRLSRFESFGQYDGTLDGALLDAALPRLQTHRTACQGLRVKAECVVFDVAKFLDLCANANPNTLEILFADERDWLHETAIWRRIHDQRRHFLTRKTQQTFLGYAMAQLRKIRTHRSWLLSPPGHKPTRAEFGLPDAGTLSRDDQNRIEQGIADRVRGYGIGDLNLDRPTRIALEERMRAFWLDLLAAPEVELESRLRAVATHALSIPVEVASTLNAERKYRAAMKHWDSYQTWKAQRNPVRAELERRFGYDTKHAMHLIRLMRMGVEILQAGTLRVRRPDAEYLLSIREGALPFDDLLAAAEALKARMEAAAENASLPADVDRSLVDSLALEAMTGPDRIAAEEPR